MKCNICKGDCKVEIAPNVYQDEFAIVNYAWGYGTSRDGEHGKLHICINCWNKHIQPLLETTIVMEGGIADS